MGWWNTSYVGAGSQTTKLRQTLKVYPYTWLLGTFPSDALPNSQILWLNKLEHHICATDPKFLSKWCWKCHLPFRINHNILLSPSCSLRLFGIVEYSSCLPVDSRVGILLMLCKICRTYFCWDKQPPCCVRHSTPALLRGPQNGKGLPWTKHSLSQFLDVQKLLVARTVLDIRRWEVSRFVSAILGLLTD